MTHSTSPSTGATGAVSTAPVVPAADAPKIVPLRHYGQWIFAAIVLLFLAKLAYDVATGSSIRWEKVGSRVFAEAIMQGLLITIMLTVVSMILGIIGGITLAVMRISSNAVLRAISSGFVWIFRGTPILVQILIWFNLALFFPQIDLVFVQLDTNALILPLTAAVLGLAANESAYMSEIIRGGIISIDPGQKEAAEALGMTQGKIMFRIILPQALRSIVPPMGNELVTLLKETSLVSVIGAGDLLTRAQQIGAADFSRMEMLLVASIWYLILTSIASIGQGFLERKLGKSRGFATPDPVWKRVLNSILPNRRSSGTSREVLR